MTAVKGFAKVKKTEKYFTADYLSENSEGYVAPKRSLSFKDAGISAGGEIKRTYFAGGELFAYLADGHVYKNDGGWVKASAAPYAKEPAVLAVVSGGEKRFLIAGESGAEWAFLSESVSVPFCERYAVFGSALFGSKGRKLYFSAPFAFGDFSAAAGAGGVFSSEGAEGDIECLCVSGDSLIIVCARKILTLTGKIQSDYAVKRVKTEFISVVKNSAAAVGSKVLFVSEGRLCEFYGQKLQAVKDLPLNADYVLSGKACSYKSLYLMPYVSGGESKIYCYDTADGSEYFITAAAGLSLIGGYAAEEEKIIRLAFTPAQSSGARSADAYGGEFDFGSCGYKTLTGLEIHACGKGEVTVRGDSADKTFYTGAGCNFFRTNVRSKSFLLETKKTSDDFAVERIKFIYTV